MSHFVDWLDNCNTAIAQLEELSSEISHLKRLNSRQKRNYNRQLNNFETTILNDLETKIHNFNYDDKKRGNDKLTKLKNLIYHIHGIMNDIENAGKEKLLINIVVLINVNKKNLM